MHGTSMALFTKLGGAGGQTGPAEAKVAPAQQ
jgi:hypothetical protein